MALDTKNDTGSENSGLSQNNPLPEILIGTAGLVGNLLVIVGLVRANFMHNVTSRILVSLAVSDLVVCLNMVVFSSAVLDVGNSQQVQNTFLGYMACKLFSDRILVWIPSTTSVTHLVLVTYERYVAIVRPFQYEDCFKLSRVYTAIAFMWVLSILMQVPYMISDGYDVTQQICVSQPCGSQTALQVFFVTTNILLIVLPTIAMLWFYWRILQRLGEDAKRLKKDNADGPAQELHLVRRKIVHTLLTIVVAFILLWFPEMILDIARNFNCNIFVPSKLEKAFLMMTFSNSAVNPIIYVFKYKGFRKAVKQAICPCCNKAILANEIDLVSLH
ncbi:octopamine receptor Oamb-like [Acanthaster planci]|uniref:Octopamine receptor Oamb-like n=1 Tax=Acanthaster planci TaxID=133434 RepID=A0A8B7XYF3_ACAPL|nr:octopamine receptor Oamb-like [Acanthaster planci]